MSAPPHLVDELNALDSLSRTRVEYFIRGAKWQRDEVPVLLAMAGKESTAEVDVEPEIQQVAPDCYQRVAEMETRYRRHAIFAIAVIGILLGGLGVAACVGNQRTINNADMARVLD